MRTNMRQFKDRLRSRRRTPETRPDPEAGLTLIEMLIVLAIISIVASLLVVNLMSRPDEARVTTTRTDIRTLSGALAMYRLDNGDYPTTQQGLQALAVQPTPAPPAWRSYVQETPKDAWGNDYVYASEGGQFTITSLGRDGKAGGEGVDADITNRPG